MYFGCLRNKAGLSVPATFQAQYHEAHEPLMDTAIERAGNASQEDSFQISLVPEREDLLCPTINALGEGRSGPRSSTFLRPPQERDRQLNIVVCQELKHIGRCTDLRTVVDVVSGRTIPLWSV